MKKKILLFCFIVINVQAHISWRSNKMQNFYKNKEVLVTGGCGFIGSHIVEELVSLGAQVTILDNLSTGFLENIEHVADKVTFINGSITDKKLCLHATRNKSHIFHLAAFISVPKSVEEPTLCHETNIDGTFNMLEAARINGVKRFVFSSSSAVYGAPTHACNEESPCEPTSPYGFSKLIDEYLCKQFVINYDIECVCMRYFNVYGERQNPNAAYAAVVAKFRDLMKQNKPITIFGDGLQTRDFIPVEQVTQINLLLGMLPAHTIKGEIFNVATGKSITVLELFEELKTSFPAYKHTPQFAPARSGDIKHSIADCGKLQKILQK
ncbi:MAG: NAD-dependent epimerase/dehydratase family protein [Candidatus Dependentiae bacterium]